MTGSSAQTQLNDIRPFAESRYEAIDLTGLAAFTLHWLQERHVPTTFENIVVAAFKLFPAKFSLEGFPSFPDAARVGRTLLQLAPKYRNWARGSVQKGFVLTESGLMKVRKVTEELGGGKVGKEPQPVPRARSPRTMDLERELEPIQSSPLFEEWRAGRLDGTMAVELLNMLGAYAYTPPRALRDRVAVLENAAAQVGRDEVVEFLRAVRKAFATRFRDA
jgi:hypothetical protein